MIVFFMWVLFGLAFIGLGIYIANADKAFNSWANVKTTIDVSDVKLYNKAVSKIWCIFGAIFIFLGLPLLAGQNSFLIIFTILGIFLECIFLMISLRKVEIKYRKR